MTNARSYQYKPCGLVYHGTKFKAREMTSKVQIVLRSKAAADSSRTDLKIPLAMADFLIGQSATSKKCYLKKSLATSEIRIFSEQISGLLSLLKKVKQ